MERETFFLAFAGHTLLAMGSLSQVARTVRQFVDQGENRGILVFHAMPGDLPGFEEATRALYAWDLARFEEQVSDWPPDIRAHALELTRAEP